MSEAKFGDLMSRVNPTILYSDAVVIRERLDLGYAPERPRFSKEETGVVRFDYYVATVKIPSRAPRRKMLSYSV